MRTVYTICGLFILMAVSVFFAEAQEPANSKDTSTSDQATATHSGDRSAKDAADAAQRIEGEKRFRTNCGRCHMPPHKFPPRVMATAIRHMRVRAMLTEEDMRLILKYMTQ